MDNRLNPIQNDDSMIIDQQFDENQMNSYNINSGRFKINSNDQSIPINTRNYVNNNVGDNNNDFKLVNNEYYGQNENIEEDQEYLRQTGEYDNEPEAPNQKAPLREKQDEIFFQRKIRNTGFWGNVKLRKGTWMVILGVILLAISIVLIAVFWRWWYGPAINMPMRIIGITILIVGFFSFLFGIISNCMMVSDPLSKSFIGSPPRITSWVLLGSVIALIIASDAITVYYSYWHNRFVNTPLIVIAIVFYFFGGLTFIVCIIRNFRFMAGEKYKNKYGEEAYIKKFKKNEYKKMHPEPSLKKENDQTRIFSKNNLIYKSNLNEKNIEESRDNNESIAENENRNITESQLNETMSSNYSENGTRKKDFRKKNMRLTPRVVNAPYSFQNNQSLNENTDVFD